jgi:hypothetical protein
MSEIGYISKSHEVDLVDLEVEVEVTCDTCGADLEISCVDGNGGQLDVTVEPCSNCKGDGDTDEIVEALNALKESLEKSVAAVTAAIEAAEE